jgi:hypothetical protein
MQILKAFRRLLLLGWDIILGLIDLVALAASEDRRLYFLLVIFPNSLEDLLRVGNISRDRRFIIRMKLIFHGPIILVSLDHRMNQVWRLKWVCMWWIIINLWVICVDWRFETIEIVVEKRHTLLVSKIVQILRKFGEMLQYFLIFRHLDTNPLRRGFLIINAWEIDRYEKWRYIIVGGRRWLWDGAIQVKLARWLHLVMPYRLVHELGRKVALLDRCTNFVESYRAWRIKITTVLPRWLYLTIHIVVEDLYFIRILSQKLREIMAEAWGLLQVGLA